MGSICAKLAMPKHTVMPSLPTTTRNANVLCNAPRHALLAPPRNATPLSPLLVCPHLTTTTTTTLQPPPQPLLAALLLANNQLATQRHQLRNANSSTPRLLLLPRRKQNLLQNPTT